jgi:hypothetical protein
MSRMRGEHPPTGRPVSAHTGAHSWSAGHPLAYGQAPVMASESAARSQSMAHRSVHVGSCPQFSVSPWNFEMACNLSLLELHHCDQVADLSPLAGLINLIHLRLINLRQIRNLNPLTQLKNLEELEGGRMPQGIEIPKSIEKKVRIYTW